MFWLGVRFQVTTVMVFSRIDRNVRPDGPFGVQAQC